MTSLNRNKWTRWTYIYLREIGISTLHTYYTLISKARNLLEKCLTSFVRGSTPLYGHLNRFFQLQHPQLRLLPFIWIHERSHCLRNLLSHNGTIMTGLYPNSYLYDLDRKSASIHTSIVRSPEKQNITYRPSFFIFYFCRTFIFSFGFYHTSISSFCFYLNSCYGYIIWIFGTTIKVLHTSWLKPLCFSPVKEKNFNKSTEHFTNQPIWGHQYFQLRQKWEASNKMTTWSFGHLVMSSVNVFQLQPPFRHLNTWNGILNAKVILQISYNFQLQIGRYLGRKKVGYNHWKLEDSQLRWG